MYISCTNTLLFGIILTLVLIIGPPHNNRKGGTGGGDPHEGKVGTITREGSSSNGGWFEIRLEATGELVYYRRGSLRVVHADEIGDIPIPVVQKTSSGSSAISMGYDDSDSDEMSITSANTVTGSPYHRSTAATRQRDRERERERRRARAAAERAAALAKSRRAANVDTMLVSSNASTASTELEDAEIEEYDESLLQLNSDIDSVEFDIPHNYYTQQRRHYNLSRNSLAADSDSAYRLLSSHHKRRKATTPYRALQFHSFAPINSSLYSTISIVSH